MNGKEFFDKLLEEENNYYIGNGITVSCYFENGMLPHFHFYSKRVQGCIRLDVPRYFCHKPIHDGLNSKEKKTVNDWLVGGGWKELVNVWNSNTENKIDITSIPDYKLLPNLNPATGKLDKENRK